MKSVKRWVSAVSASALALGMVVLSACSVVSNDGTIGGNYRDAEDADIQQLLTSLGSEDLFGDAEAEGWKYGLRGETSLDFSISQGDTFSSSAGIGADLSILLEEGEAGFSAGGKLSLKSEEKSGEGEASADLSIEPYMDGEYIYLKVSGTRASTGGESSVTQRLKIAYGGLGLVVPDLTELPSQIVSSFGDAAAFRASLEASGVDMDVDTSSGIKARFTYSSEGVKEAIKEALGSLVTVDTSSYTIDCSDSVLEMYLSIDENGVLEAVSMRVDIEATVPSPHFDFGTQQVAEEAAPLELSMNGMFALMSDDADVVFPTDLDSYEDLDLSDILSIPGLWA